MAKNFFRVANGLKFPGLSAPPSDPQNGDIYYDTTLGKFQQYVAGSWSDLGGGVGGVGDVTDIQVRLEDKLVTSAFQAVTPNIISVDQATKVASSTGTLEQNDYLLNATQNLISTQNLDADFLASGRDLLSADVQLFYNLAGMDNNPVVELSRDGGVSYQAVSVSRRSGDDSWAGSLDFADSEPYSTIDQYAVANADNSSELYDTGSGLARGQSFILAGAAVVRRLTVYLAKTGSPAGNFYVSIVKNSGGLPSTLQSDYVFTSAAQPASGLSAGNNTVQLSVPNLVLAPGTYHIVITTDAAYKASYVAATTSIAVRYDNSSATAPGSYEAFDGTTWTTIVGTPDMVYLIEGRPMDLRLRVTSGTAGSKLKGYGVFYDKGVSDRGGVYSNEVVTMDTTANPQKVTVGFLPDPDLVEVNDLETGQTFLYPAFTIDGYDIKFTTNPFPVSPSTRQFRVRQSKGASVDNNEKNAALLAANRLGSTNPSLDRSVAGEGILLRASNGQLVEASIQWNGSNYVWQFATVS